MTKQSQKTSLQKEKKRIVLLDAHAILHRAYHALPDFTSPDGVPTGALYGVVTMLLKITEELQPDYIAACYDLPEPTYRHVAYENYKAGRAKTDDELVSQINKSKEIFEAFHIPIYEAKGFEADDVLGTIVSKKTENKNLEFIIASGDMDTMQLVDDKQVQVYTLKKGIKDTILYDEKAVKERFGFLPEYLPDYKGLSGDPSDNIPGIPGIGDKTAKELISKYGSIEDIYKKLETDEETFTKDGIKPRVIKLLQEHKEEAEFSKMLATINLKAPVEFNEPEKSWKDVADTDAILRLFNELGFRSLAPRINKIFSLDEDKSMGQVANQISDDEVERVSIMLWLINSDITNPSYDDIVDYGRANFDTTDFKEIEKKLEELLKEYDLVRVYENIELPLKKVISYMNSVGIKLDVSYLKKLSHKLHKELSKIEKEVFGYAGREFNLNSPKQLAEVLYDDLGLKPKNQKKTATGQRTTRESELEKMKEDHPVIEKILRHRELQKLLSTYIDVFPDLVDENNRLHTTFLQTGTTTGRLSSRDPNLQNIPIRSKEGKEMRKGFISSEGYRIVSIDYSQIDLRMAAILSGDKNLIDIFKRGEDVHTGVASRVFNVAEDEVTKDMRRKAKVINFGILYGMGVNALKGNLGEDATREEAQEFLNAYFNTFTRLSEYLEETKAYARQHGYTATLFGRRRYFPGIKSNAPFIKAHAERMAINAPVQGTAADVMRVAMNEVYSYIKNQKLLEDARMMLQVHDEIVFEIKEDLLDELIPKLKQKMESVLKDFDTKEVPIEVDIATGYNWTELSEWENK